MSDLTLTDARTLVRLLTDNPREIKKLRRACGHELKRARREADAWNDRVEGGIRAMSNFMAGVTWALMCRVALRESRHHQPAGGIRPASGEMWLPREVMYARTRSIAKRGWDPCTAERWWDVRQDLLADMSRRPDPENVQVARFVIPLVREEVGVAVTAKALEVFDG